MNGAVIETFNTHRMSEAAIKALDTGREAEQQAIKAAIERNLDRIGSTSTPEHVALYGPRGFGKSFMTRLIEIWAQQHGTRLRYLLLPEEQHNLARSPDALLRYFEQLLLHPEKAWEQAAFTWPSGDASARWSDAVKQLDAAIDQTFPDGQGLVVAVVENFDMLLRDVFGEASAEERLRKWMTRKANRIMLFVTATGTVDIDYDRPLFRAFTDIRLPAWSEAECLEYFHARRKLEGKPELTAEQIGRVRAITLFTGGNPRMSQLLGQVLDDNDALRAAELLNALADKLADYYRRRIDDLPQLSRGLLDALIRGGEPCTPTELAKRVGTEQSKIARPFALLRDHDIIVGQPATGSSEIRYRVADRVMVHFYRLRYGGVAPGAISLAAIVDFLQLYFDQSELLEEAKKFAEKGMHLESEAFQAAYFQLWDTNTEKSEKKASYIREIHKLSKMETEKLLDLFKDRIAAIESKMRITGIFNKEAHIIDLFHQFAVIFQRKRDFPKYFAVAQREIEFQLSVKSFHDVLYFFWIRDEKISLGLEVGWRLSIFHSIINSVFSKSTPKEQIYGLLFITVLGFIATSNDYLEISKAADFLSDKEIPEQLKNLMVAAQAALSAGKTSESLERVDPDFAKVLRLVWDLPLSNIQGRERSGKRFSRR